MTILSLAMLLCVFIFGLHNVRAVHSHLRFSQIYFQQGLRSDWVFDVAIDSLGFVWFAGHTGLTRYDGRSSRHFYANPALPNSLTENQVFRLLVANDNEIFCSTIGGGLNLLHIETGAFTEVSLGEDPDLKYVSTGLKINEERYIFLAGRKRHIVILSREGNTFSATQIPLKWSNDNISFHENKTRDIFIDPSDSNILWIIGNFRIFTFDLKSKKLTLEIDFFETLRKHFSFESIVAVSWLDSDHMILNILDKGFHRFNVRNHTLEFLFPDPVAPEATAVIEKSSEGFFWLGSRNGKLFTYDHLENHVENISLFPHDLKPFSIETIHEAPNGTIYIGTMGQGVLKHNPLKNVFRNIELRNLDVSNDDFIRVGNLHDIMPYYYFTKTRQNGVFRMDLTGNSVLMLSESDIENINRGNMMNWKNNNLLMHNGKQLFKIDTQTNSLERYSLPLLESITRSNDRHIWFLIPLLNEKFIVRGNDFLILFDNDKEWFTDLREYMDIQFVENPTAVWENERILLHDEEFLFEWRPSCNTINRIRFSDPHFNSMFKSIRRLFPFRDHYYLFCALQGALKVKIGDEGIDVIEHLTAPGKLISNNIYNATLDNDSVFWLATGLGIVRFDPAKDTFIYFSYEQNLPNLYQDRPPRINESGYFALNTLEQFIWARKKELSPTGISSNIVVNSILINDIERVSGILSNPNTTMTLKYFENNIRISWSHITPLPHAYYSMEYMLENFDETWKIPTNGFFATYTNIPPGKYTLRIRARNLHDKNEYTALVLPLSVIPAFWATIWFRSVIIVILVFVIYILFKWKIDSVKKEERLKTEYNKRLAELELTNLRSQMNPHFMFNSLNSIKHFILKNEKEKAAEYLSNFAQLVRDILNYSKVEHIALEDEINTLKRYIELEQMRFNRGFECEFIIDSHLDTHQLQVQPLILQPFVENAIWHGLMHKASDRKMQVRISSHNDKLLCQVEDNGVGRNQANVIQEKSGVKKSYGIKITQLRMQQNDKDARIEVIDLKDLSGNPSGTLVNISLPFKISEESFV